MHNKSLFNPQIGHDACGVGFLAKIDAAPCHDLVLHAVQALGNMAHRGGSGSGLSLIHISFSCQTLSISNVSIVQRIEKVSLLS